MGRQRTVKGAYSDDFSEKTQKPPGNMEGKLTYIDEDNSVGSGPVGDRRVGHKPFPVPDSNDPGTPSKR